MVGTVVRVRILKTRLDAKNRVDRRRKVIARPACTTTTGSIGAKVRWQPCCTARRWRRSVRPLPAPRMRSDQWVFNRRPSFTLGEFNGTVFFSAVVADLHLSQSIRLAPIPLGSPVRAAGRLCGWRETQRVPMTRLQRLGAGSSTRLIPSLLATRDHDHELRSGTGG